jgi:hypothetical protein
VPSANGRTRRSDLPWLAGLNSSLVLSLRLTVGHGIAIVVVSAWAGRSSTSGDPENLEKLERGLMLGKGPAWT